MADSKTKCSVHTLQSLTLEYGPQRGDPLKAGREGVLVGDDTVLGIEKDFML